MAVFTWDASVSAEESLVTCRRSVSSSSCHSPDQGRPCLMAQRQSPVIQGPSVSRPSRDAVFFQLHQLVKGSHLQDLLTSSTWSQAEGRLYINLLEMHPILVVIHAFQDIDRPHCGVDEWQNLDSGMHQQAGVTVSLSLYLPSRQVLAWAECNSMIQVARYIPGPRNVVADQLGPNSTS